MSAPEFVEQGREMMLLERVLKIVTSILGLCENSDHYCLILLCMLTDFISTANLPYLGREFTLKDFNVLIVPQQDRYDLLIRCNAHALQSDNNS